MPSIVIYIDNKLMNYISCQKISLTMETIIAAAFGQRVEVQKGESSVLVKAASEMLYSFQDNGGLGLEGYSMLLCKLQSVVLYNMLFIDLDTQLQMGENVSCSFQRKNDFKLFLPPPPFEMSGSWLLV